MLRPATPLAVIFLAAFALLLLSTLSTPIIKAIPLAEWKGTKFGVFGYCMPDKKCSSIAIGYSYGMSPRSASNLARDEAVPQAGETHPPVGFR